MQLDDINIFDSKPPTPEEILAAGPGATVRPLDPFERMSAFDRVSTDPVKRKLQKVGRGLGSLFAVETPLDYALSGLAAAKPVVAAGKGIAAIAKQAEPKDLVFVHNTSEDAIKSFDAMGGIPSPSIAVTKADQPFVGFGNIQLIGKPEKFDPLIDPRNKIYSSDAFTPRAPKKIRLAKESAEDQFKKDYKEFASDNVNRGAESLKRLNKTRGANILQTEFDNFDSFFNSDIARMKFLKEIGRDPMTPRSAPFPRKKYKEWVKKQKDKYLSQDGVFTVFDDLEETMVAKPYTLDNVVENMVQETQRGGEGGLDLMMGENKLRALMAEQFKDLPDIKAKKGMLQEDEEVFDLLSEVEIILDEATDHKNFDYAMKTLPKNYSDSLLDYVGEELKGGRKDLEPIVNEFVENLEIPKEKLNEITGWIADTLRMNAMRPVKYFEAKPTRAVGFDEFAGAIVPENTSKEVVDILEKRGLKVIKQKTDDVYDYGKGKIRQQFGEQFFSMAPIAAGASATAMMEEEDRGIGSL